jgi:DNA (cytosine-5)-methyltransferase 1
MKRDAVKVGSLFAGIGGFDLAARWMGWETAWFSEIDPYASAVLAKHWPGVPNYGDITKIDFTRLEPVDIVCGGFPCQDISRAGSHAGIDGEKSGLWREFARALRELRPRYALVENSATLTQRGLGRVLGDLAEIGYDAEWHCYQAADLGAPHLRDRLYILAYSSLGRRSPQDEAVQAGGQGSELHPGWAREPRMDRVAHGVPAGVDRRRVLGAAVVPQCALLAFEAIQEAEARLAA